MLHSSIVLPCAAEWPIGAWPDQRLRSNAVLMALQDLVRDCLLVSCNRSCTPEALLNSISRWPTEYRKAGQEVLRRLKQQNRFVHRVKDTETNKAFTCPPFAECSASTCLEHVAELPSFCVPRATLSVEPCATRLRSEGCSSIVVIEEYSTSTFKQRSKGPIIIADGELSSSEFAERILVPVFRHASFIRIVDRWVGRSLVTPEGEEDGLANYRRTLTWICELIKSSAHDCPQRLEILTGVDRGPLDMRALQKVVADFGKMGCDLQHSTGLEIAFDIRLETRRQKLQHARYLVTDQVVLLIERGFDLLWDDKRMQIAKLDPAVAEPRVRDVSVSICERDDYGKVEVETRKLKTIEEEIKAYRPVMVPPGLIVRSTRP